MALISPILMTPIARSAGSSPTAKAEPTRTKTSRPIPWAATVVDTPPKNERCTRNPLDELCSGPTVPSQPDRVRDCGRFHRCARPGNWYVDTCGFGRCQRPVRLELQADPGHVRRPE